MLHFEPAFGAENFVILDAAVLELFIMARITHFKFLKYHIFLLFINFRSIIFFALLINLSKW